MSAPVPFDEYVSTLSRITPHVNPLTATPESEAIRKTTASIEALEVIDRASLQSWVEANPHDVPVLGLLVGLGQEKLKNALVDEFQTAGHVTLARKRAGDLIAWLDEDFDLVDLTNEQVGRRYELADVLVARAGGRATATAAGRSGRQVEDVIEQVASDLGLPFEPRTRFTGRSSRTAPCDLAIPNGADAEIVIAAKGFDSTGSKLTDAVREIEEMAAVRTSNQFAVAVIDGIGWKSRISDLRRIHALWADKEINGMYTLQTMGQFAADIDNAARLRHLL